MRNRLVFVEYVLVPESPSWKVSVRRENLAAIQRQVFSDPTPKEIHHFWQISKSSGLRMQMARFGGDCHLRQGKKKDAGVQVVGWGKRGASRRGIFYISGWCLKSGSQGGYRICVAHSWCAAHSCEDYISRRANFSSGASRNRTYITK